MHETVRRLADYTDFTLYMLRNYEQEDLVPRMKALVDGVHPLYKQMTAYCRHRLRQRYGNDAAPNGGLVPDHLIGEPPRRVGGARSAVQRKASKSKISFRFSLQTTQFAKPTPFPANRWTSPAPFELRSVSLPREANCHEDVATDIKMGLCS